MVAGLRGRMPSLGLATLAGMALVTGWLAIDPDDLWRGHVTNQALRASIETAVFLLALAGSALLIAHVRRTRRLRDLFLLASLVCATVTALVFDGLPAYGYEPAVYGGGARLAMTMLMAAAFLGAAFCPDGRRVQKGRRWARRAAMAGVGLGAALDVVAGPVFTPGASGIAQAAVVAVVVVAFGGFLVAACGFAAWSRGDAVNAWLLAGSALLLGGTQLHMVSDTPVPSDWVTATDAFRICAFALLLILSVRLYRASQAQVATDAIHAERLRIARDLHDGLAQDLAFIASHSERLSHSNGVEHPLTVAARRALAASRGKIVDLQGSRAPTTEAALREVSAELSSRFAVDVSVNADPFAGQEPVLDERSALVRIAREAIVNSVRHGGARKISVTLGAPSDGVLLRVSDDGCGFASADRATAGTGLGLGMMHDRAAQIGAELQACARTGGGGQIEIVSPELR